jgi:SAM-dependent methyltransferase
MFDNNPTVVADDWDSHWSEFDESAATNPAQHYRHRLLIRAVRGLRPRRLVDIGSGQGDLLVRMRRSLPNIALFGLELSVTGVQKTLSKVAVADVRCINLLDPDAATRISDVRADVAVCSEVLEHLDDPRTFLEAASAALKPGATLIVTVPGGPLSEFDRMIGHRRHYTPDALSLLLQSAGFVVSRVDRAGFPFFNLYRLVVIGRGSRLAKEVSVGSTSRLAGFAMAVFDILFHFNAGRSRWGWQLVAVARWPATTVGHSRGC